MPPKEANGGSTWVGPLGETVTEDVLVAALVRTEHALLMVRGTLGNQAHRRHLDEDLARDLTRALVECGDSIAIIRGYLAGTEPRFPDTNPPRARGVPT